MNQYQFLYYFQLSYNDNKTFNCENLINSVAIVTVFSAVLVTRSTKKSPFNGSNRFFPGFYSSSQQSKEGI